jgi:hypothetical protein
MSRKISFLLLVFVITMSLAIFIFACNSEENSSQEEQLPSVLSAKSYLDYAELVKFDSSTYPELEDQGLFWTKWDSTTNSRVEIAADSQAGTDLVDTNKPTLIFVHGMLTNGNVTRQPFNLPSAIAYSAAREFGLTDNVQLIKLWLDAGWNVGLFHYNRFTAEGVAAWNVENKIWSVDSRVGMRFTYPDGSYSDTNVSEYCLAEHLAAEYVRAVNLLPESFGTTEIRFAGHSMGGELSASGLFLISELVRVNQLPQRALPDRYALLDPLLGISLGEGDSLSADGITTGWSDVPLIDDHTGSTMLECIRVLAEYGIPIEFYAYKKSWLIGMTKPSITKKLKELITYTYLDPTYEGYTSLYSYMTDAHGIINDWYLCSIAFKAPLNTTNGRVANIYAASASTPTEYLKTLQGKTFIIDTGASTVTTVDDTFIETD